MHFPAGETANLFRGQFGKILHRYNPAMYDRFFAPVRETGVPSGLHDPPRPFVLRVRHLEGATLQSFHIGLNVFETDEAELVHIYQAIDDLARETLRAEFHGIQGSDLLRLPLAGAPPAERVRVTFLSPAELKGQESPEFGPMFARIRDRIGTLRALYGAGPLEIDFKAMGKRATAIRMTHCDVRDVEVERVSRNRRHPLGGFTGVAEYEGSLTEFIPYLEIASYTGVGRQTVWGKGEISVETF